MTFFDSIHLQNFPDVSNIVFEKDIVDKMDLVREVCSATLFLRDKKNLRVRLPLKEVKIIGQNVKNIEKYRDIIADEINVKNVIFEEKLEDFADFLLELDFKKLGVKYGEKLKDITKIARENKWKKLNDGKISIAGIILEKNEFVIKLKSKNNTTENIQVLPNNKVLVELDCTLTPELELEGIARDLIRIIQQNRKNANLNLADQIKFSLKTDSKNIIDAVNSNKNYIKEQILSTELNIVDNVNERFSFEENFNENHITIGFSVVK
jgi:isoleucyl-tRNA synthetase